MNISVIKPELKGVIALDPSEGVTITGRARLSPLSGRHQAETTETGEGIQVYIPAVSELINRHYAVQSTGAVAIKTSEDSVPTDVQAVYDGVCKRGSKMCRSSLANAFGTSTPKPTRQNVIVERIWIEYVVVPVPETQVLSTGELVIDFGDGLVRILTRTAGKKKRTRDSVSVAERRIRI